jgi:hypothetical protein
MRPFQQSAARIDSPLCDAPLTAVSPLGTGADALTSGLFSL